MLYSEKIKKDFENSWDEVTSYFKESAILKNTKQLDLMINLIHEFKGKGYNSLVRAGTYLYFLQLTRARLHNGKYSIALKIAINNDNMFEVYKYDYDISNEKTGFICVNSVFENDTFNSWMSSLIKEEIK